MDRRRRRIESARGEQGRQAPTIGRRSWCRRRGRRTATTSWSRSRGRPSRAPSACSCITATAATGVRIGPAPPPQPGPDAQGPPPPPPANRMGAVVSPDGRFIYYAQRTGTFTYNARFPLWQIYRHDRETGDVTQITNAQGSAYASAALARRQVDGLRHPSQVANRHCASAISRPAPSAGWPTR